MARKGNKSKDTLKLTPQEAESMGVEMKNQVTPPVPEAVRELPMHEQVLGSLTEDDVIEAMTGEVTEEGREDVEEAIADRQEDEAEEENSQ